MGELDRSGDHSIKDSDDAEMHQRQHSRGEEIQEAEDQM